MNKKFLGIFAALVVLGSTGAFASAAIGLQGGAAAGNAWGYNAAVTFKLSSFDAVFAVDLGLTNNWGLDTLAFQADWWVQNPRLAGMIHYYWGPGFAAGVYGLTGGNIGFYGAFRLVGGINVFVVDPLELYLQAAWQPGLYVGSNGLILNADTILRFPIQFGFRFWF